MNINESEIGDDEIYSWKTIIKINHFIFLFLTAGGLYYTVEFKENNSY